MVGETGLVVPVLKVLVEAVLADLDIEVQSQFLQELIVLKLALVVLVELIQIYLLMEVHLSYLAYHRQRVVVLVLGVQQLQLLQTQMEVQACIGEEKVDLEEDPLVLV